MSKETLSVNQANQIINVVNHQIRNTKKEMENTYNDFLVELSQLWEDQNAVRFSKNINSFFKDALQRMNKGNKAIENAVKNKADMYNRVGGMSKRVTASAITLEGELKYGVVKEYFSNSENSDDFGFMNPTEQGIYQIREKVAILYHKIESEVWDLMKNLNKVNAFGNIDVQLAINKIASELWEGIYQNIQSWMNRELTYTLSRTMEEYINAGKVAKEGMDWIDKNVGFWIDTNEK